MASRPAQPDATAPPRVGTPVGAPFSLPGFEDVVLIGRGGFALVFRAFQPAFERTVAVKVLMTPMLSAEDLRRFERECRAVGRLSGHPGIVTVYSSGLDEAGRPYLVMEHMGGGSLGDRLERDGSLGVEEVLSVGMSLAAALEAAHTSGVLHRDLKPANVLVSSYGEAKLADFGIARLVGAETTAATAFTPAYAAPEVGAGGEPSVAADVYSLGATLHCLLGGEPPFSRRAREDLVAYARRVAAADPPGLARRGVPEVVAGVVARALAKQPDERFLTAAEVGDALGAAQEALGFPRTAVPVAAAPDRVIDLPIGVVTFLLTDIERSIALWEADRAAMDAALARHDELVEEAVRAHRGSVLRLRGEGDSTLSVFASASDATACALSIQQALAAESWATPEPLRVRMALHAGEGEGRTGDHDGPTMNRATRIRSVAHGAQVLVSGTVAELAGDALPFGCSLLDLGTHHLADLTRPVHLFQLCHPDLPVEFPPLATLEAALHNLPMQPTSFVGREIELRDLEKLLLEERLVTLHGPPGSGKTRLALQAAADSVEGFPAGVFFTDLAPISDPDLVPSAVAKAAGIIEEPGTPVVVTVTAFLRNRVALVLLDNCEHVLEPVADLAARLLDACPNLTILATSRQPLGVSAETVFPVPPLEIPPPGLPFDAVSGFEAIRLFADRAKRANPRFSLADHAPAVVEICRRLDGIPLAVELAAARVRALSPEALLDRLSGRFDALTGPRDAPARHRTLRAALEWSFDLLDDDERAILARLSVFAGGCTLAAIEAVCGEGLDVLTGLGSLVQQSLVRYDEIADRYAMLESVREFAAEHFEDSAEASDIRARHAEYFAEWAEGAEDHLCGREAAIWLDWLEADHDNLRVALDHLGTGTDPESDMRLAAALAEFWWTRGHLAEGRERLGRSLERASTWTPSWAKAASALGDLALDQGDYEEARRHYGAALEVAAALGDRRGAAVCLLGLGHLALDQGDYETARLHYEAVREVAEDLGDRREVAACLSGLGHVDLRQGAYEEARSHYEAARDVLDGLGDRQGAAVCLSGLGHLARLEGDYEEARAHYLAARAVFDDLGDARGAATCLLGLGHLALDQGDYPGARLHYDAAHSVFEDLGDRRGAAVCLTGLGHLARFQGDHPGARSHYEVAHSVFDDLGDRREAAACLFGLGRLARDESRLDEASRLLRTSLATFHDLGVEPRAGLAIEALAGVGLDAGQPERAARFFGAAAGIEVHATEARDPHSEERHQADLAACREALGDEAFEKAFSGGRALSLDQAVAEALEWAGSR